MGRFDDKSTKERSEEREEEQVRANERYMQAKKYYDNPKNPLYGGEREPIKEYILTGKKIRPKRPTQQQRTRTIPARKGFHGNISRPTKFLVGEHGSEHVDISPIKKNKSMYDFDFMASYTKVMFGTKRRKSKDIQFGFEW